MTRSKSGGASRWILVSVVAGALGACISSSGGGGGNATFDSGLEDATFSSDGGDGGSPDAASGDNLAGCLVGLGTTLATGGDAGACGTLYECMASHCGSQLTSCLAATTRPASPRDPSAPASAPACRAVPAPPLGG